jgi:UDP-N-acetylmuramoyl-L-alanyl-D-glutamate--2,6-diaminopimelate ligase
MINVEEICSKYSVELKQYNYEGIEWKSQASKRRSILFYKANSDSTDEINKFNERIDNCEFGVCFTNLKLEKENVIVLDEKIYKSIQEDLLNVFYPFDSQAKCMLGVTGTNGKTTTVELIRQTVLMRKLSVLTIGTLGVYLDDKLVENFSLTSPSYIDLRKVLNKYSTYCHIIAMELSSHALEQNRIGSIRFDKIGWTNLTQDHLDYHGDMDSYFKAKSHIFNYLKDSGEVVVSRKQEELKSRLIDYDFIETTQLGKIKNLFFCPDYNKENLEVVVALLKDYIDISLEMVECLDPPPGRFNIIQDNSNFIVIDYAHTPDGLESICSELKKTFPKYKLVTVFGCGGDRDKSKRELMAKAASQFSDYIYLTSDNPRFEDPLQIIEDAEKGISTPFKKNIERKSAIVDALNSHENSVILVAGKGHENYIDINGEKLPYSDEQVVKEALQHD